MKKILVIGDTILDHYVYGTVSRVNPEAPHSVVFDVDGNQELKLGGACNVAANIRGLLPDAVIHYFGVSNDITEALLSKSLISVVDSEILHRDVLLKTRYVCGSHHMLRVDHGSKYYLSSMHVLDLLSKKIDEYDYDLIVVSDYNKGTITDNVSEIIVKKGKKVLFDIKKSENLWLWPASSHDNFHVILKCNQQEYESEISSEILNRVSVVKTRGVNGCDVYDEKVGAFLRIPGIQTSVADVVGAGDSFLAGMAASFIQTNCWNVQDMAHYGNKCAAEKVKHFGTHVVRKEDIE